MQLLFFVPDVSIGNTIKMMITVYEGFVAENPWKSRTSRRYSQCNRANLEQRRRNCICPRHRHRRGRRRRWAPLPVRSLPLDQRLGPYDLKVVHLAEVAVWPLANKYSNETKNEKQ